MRHVRVGFIVPKYGHSSVERNLLKRRLREITRTYLLGTLPAVDVVVRALPSSYGADYATLLTELRKSALEIEVPLS